MIIYPKIEYYTKGRFGEPILAFDKADGSNIRVEWSRKRYKKCKTGDAFYKFGSRTQLISDKTPILGPSIDIFYEKYADGIEQVLIDNKKYRSVDSVVVFLEYFGPNSFAGWHNLNDEMDLLLFDVHLKSKGFVKPIDFVEDFGHLGIPNVVYDGIFDMEFVNNVRNNIYNLKEGVVAKGVITERKKSDIWMVKVKTLEWLKKVHEQHGMKALLSEVDNDENLLE